MPQPGSALPRPVSDADHHRRRRRIAAGVLGGLALVVIGVLAFTAGNSASWNPQGLREGVAAELPRLRLDAQARRAAKVIAAQKQERAVQNGAINRVLTQTPYITEAGAQTRSVALTFDDGPSPYTQRILDTLQRYKAKATFFTLGNQLGSFPFPLQRAVAEGHAIGDHTWNHADLTRLGAPDVADEIGSASKALQKSGVPRPRLFRPPYGAYNEQTLTQARKKNMLTVLWTIDTSDYRAYDPNAMAQQVLTEAKPGAIILMHDGGGDRTVTSKALPLIVKGLRDRGYKMVTLPQLLVSNPPEAQQGATGRSEAA